MFRMHEGEYLHILIDFSLFKNSNIDFNKGIKQST